VIFYIWFDSVIDAEIYEAYLTPQLDSWQGKTEKLDTKTNTLGANKPAALTVKLKWLGFK
jgi:hypothetical protein